MPVCVCVAAFVQVTGGMNHQEAYAHTVLHLYWLFNAPCRNYNPTWLPLVAEIRFCVYIHCVLVCLCVCCTACGGTG